jgi:hypothetical protein
MAFPYMIGPGGQPFIIQQVPLISQPMMQQVPIQQQQQQQQQPPVSQPQKLPDYMSEERLQDKGRYYMSEERLQDKGRYYNVSEQPLQNTCSKFRIDFFCSGQVSTVTFISTLSIGQVMFKFCRFDSYYYLFKQ